MRATAFVLVAALAACSNGDPLGPSDYMPRPSAPAPTEVQVAQDVSKCPRLVAGLTWEQAPGWEVEVQVRTGDEYFEMVRTRDAHAEWYAPEGTGDVMFRLRYTESSHWVYATLTFGCTP